MKTGIFIDDPYVPLVPTFVREMVVPEMDTPFVPMKLMFPICPLIDETGAVGLTSSSQSAVFVGVVVERM